MYALNGDYSTCYLFANITSLVLNKRTATPNRLVNADGTLTDAGRFYKNAIAKYYK